MPAPPRRPLRSWLAEQQGALLAQGVTQLSPVPLPEPGRGKAGERLGQQGKVAMLKEAQEALEGRWLALQAGWCQAQHQLLEQLREEKERHHNLEEQVNAMIQFNVAEVGMLHHNVACMEERTAYSTHERARDVWEVLDAFHTRLSQLEAQQQAAQLEEQDRSSATLCHLHRQLMNLAVAVTTILLVCVSACSRQRALSSLGVLALLSVAWHCWDHLRWEAW
ncbi:testis-specific protein TEX28 [Mauremys reevesii]|uniref:testis-specific protein TEX28 n=1 Tax=Mauremys reevesii TaxID=260615 RepID=UPI00193FBFE1|nr:testis-specific protein TEX28 [Mauremys reevesii]